MKSRFVADLQPNEAVTSCFLVESKDVRLKKSGDPYLSLVLCDRTGRLEAKMWDGIGDVVDTFDQDDFVKIKGMVQLYRERPQITIQRLKRIDESEVDLADYLPHTSRDIGEMWAELTAAVDAVGDADLKRLLAAFLDDEEIALRLRKAPAAKTLHHAFVGGLLEHITSLLRLAERVAGNYDFVDLDLVRTGVVLHDLGKIYELTYERSFGYGDEGQLLGHIVMVLRMLDRKCSELDDFPPKLKMLVEHLILSHHGKYEFGSPKLPMFPEALLLHYIDDLDSKLESMRASVASEASAGELWTRYNPSLERRLLNKELFLAGSAASETGAEQTTVPPPNRGGQPGSLFGERLEGALQAKRNKP